MTVPIASSAQAYPTSQIKQVKGPGLKCMFIPSQNKYMQETHIILHPSKSWVICTSFSEVLVLYGAVLQKHPKSRVKIWLYHDTQWNRYGFSSDRTVIVRICFCGRLCESWGCAVEHCLISLGKFVTAYCNTDNGSLCGGGERAHHCSGGDSVCFAKPQWRS